MFPHNPDLHWISHFSMLSPKRMKTVFFCAVPAIINNLKNIQIDLIQSQAIEKEISFQFVLDFTEPYSSVATPKTPTSFRFSNSVISLCIPAKSVLLIFQNERILGLEAPKVVLICRW